MCEECDTCHDRTGRLVVARQSNPLFVPSVMKTHILLTGDPAQEEDLLQRYQERIEKLSQQDRVIKLCIAAGFLTKVEVGQYFVTKDTAEFSQFTDSVACREYTLPRDEDSSEPVCLKGVSIVSFSVAFAALTILVSFVVPLLGGGNRHRAPLFHGASEGQCLFVFTGVQQQCVTRCHFLAASGKSGTVRSAGLPAECEWISEGPSAPHTSHEFNSLNGSSRRIRCLEDQENQFQTCERHFAKVIILDGWSVPVVHSFEEFQLADTGICLATRSEAEEAMRELRSGGGLAILTTKQVVAGSEEIEFEVKTSKGLSTMWKPTLSAAGRRSGHIQVFCAKRRSCGGRRLHCSDRFPQKVLPSRCVEDSHDWTATAYWLKKLGAEPSGILTTQIRRDRWCRSGGQGSKRQLREGSSRKRGVWCLLWPLLCQRRRPRVQGCPTPS